MLKISEYMTIKQASKYLGVSGNTLRSWEKLEKIKPIRNPMNNYRLYKKEDLDKILKTFNA